MEDMVVDDRILKLILKNYKISMLTGFMWLRTESIMGSLRRGNIFQCKTVFIDNSSIKINSRKAQRESTFVVTQHGQRDDSEDFIFISCSLYNELRRHLLA